MDPKKYNMPRWNNPFFRKTKSSLDEELSRILSNVGLINYLGLILDYDQGLHLGTLSYRDYSKVDVEYGLTRGTSNSVKLYFIKPAPITHPVDIIVVKNDSIKEISDIFLPKTSLPSSSKFISQLNNSLKHSYKKLDYLTPKQILS